MVEYIAAIDVARVRFPADAHAGHSAAWPDNAKDVGAIAPHIVGGLVHAYMLELHQCTKVCAAMHE